MSSQERRNDQFIITASRADGRFLSDLAEIRTLKMNRQEIILATIILAAVSIMATICLL